MACPTCDHTMHSINAADTKAAFPIFWCPRCGTVKISEEHNYPPMLVERCRAFEKDIPGNVISEMAVWKRLGIAESINTPSERK